MSQNLLFHQRIASSQSSFDKMLGEVLIPRFRLARQRFRADRLDDTRATLLDELAKPGRLGAIGRGKRVAIAVGSRGIANVTMIVRELAAAIRRAGADPFIVPGMGSHGGATAEGQRQMLASIGISEELCGAPVVSSMEVKRIGQATVTVRGEKVLIPVFLDANALAADALVPVVRVKPHTAYRGPYESGICKMLVIGLGKHVGAMAYHKYGFGIFAEVIPAVAGSVLAQVNVPFTLACVENARHQTAVLEAVPGGEIMKREPELLKIAFSFMGRLYFDNLDELVVEQIGKDISGDGMDPNITGTYWNEYCGKGLSAESRVVLGLSEGSHGSAVGLGMADYTTVKTMLQVDPVSTYTNVMTSRATLVAHLPMVMPDDLTAIRAGIFKSTSPTADAPRIVKIRDTGNVDCIEISESLWPEAEAHPEVTLESEAYDLAFDQNRRLVSRLRERH
ncbi:MAG: DUF362 domain-containing protein [Candidatus Accumulibacter sp.]|jgi:hypothetical protein|nr:DUF362 domain-containing protein [Accumulibacter sp.]